VAGAGFGFLTGLVLSTGPPERADFHVLWVDWRRIRGNGSGGLSALFASKVATFRRLGALPQGTLLQGGVVAASLMAGTSVGKVRCSTQ
jgi:uncharacterized protein